MWCYVFVWVLFMHSTSKLILISIRNSTTTTTNTSSSSFSSSLFFLSPFLCFHSVNVVEKETKDKKITHLFFHSFSKKKPLHESNPLDRIMRTAYIKPFQSRFRKAIRFRALFSGASPFSFLCLSHRSDGRQIPFSLGCFLLFRRSSLRRSLLL